MRIALWGASARRLRAARFLDARVDGFRAPGRLVVVQVRHSKSERPASANGHYVTRARFLRFPTTKKINSQTKSPTGVSRRWVPH